MLPPCGLRFTGETRDVNIGQSRILNQVNLTLAGHGNTITGCDIRPKMTAAAGTDWFSVVGCTQNGGKVVDQSGNNRNLFLAPPAAA